jgi:hypothetical protein
VCLRREEECSTSIHMFAKPKQATLKTRNGSYGQQHNNESNKDSLCIHHLSWRKRDRSVRLCSCTRSDCVADGHRGEGVVVGVGCRHRICMYHACKSCHRDPGVTITGVRERHPPQDRHHRSQRMATSYAHCLCNVSYQHQHRRGQPTSLPIASCTEQS